MVTLNIPIFVDGIHGQPDSARGNAGAYLIALHPRTARRNKRVRGEKAQSLCEFPFGISLKLLSSDRKRSEELLDSDCRSSLLTRQGRDHTCTVTQNAKDTHLTGILGRGVLQTTVSTELQYPSKRLGLLR